ncbi:hypothetical protein WMY93_022295 [Mugilogobius chulae]|uniref:Uncharacterized protein n=1 Tax=Mugilogobius chulae TaxID=88201 RepID=A0AAW0N7R5_9GOBI
MTDPPESVPLQWGYKYNPNMVQTTAVQNSSVQVMREMPKDHFIWSLICCFYYNPLCLGLAALIFSVKARDRKVVGDIESARSYGSTARTLNIISTHISQTSQKPPREEHANSTQKGPRPSGNQTATFLL